MAAHLVLLAGGRGTRFWPLSRRHRPKQLLPLLGRRSLLEDTWTRVAPLGDAARSWLVTAADLRADCRRALPALPAAQVLGEPAGRNTAAAVALAAVLALRQDPRAVLAVFPSDHHVADVPAFRRLARRALRCAREERAFVTLGITPTRAATDYGYLELAGAARGDEPVDVARFVEKPAAPLAAEYAASGRHLWNSGIFFLHAAALRASFERHAPALWAALDALPDTPADRPRWRHALEAAYDALPSIAFDVAIMEKEREVPVRVIPADVGWSDVGGWSALGELLAPSAGNRVEGDVVALDATDNIVLDREGVTALLGVEGLVVVRAGDAVLVARRDRLDDLRELVGLLAAREGGRYL